LLQSATALCHGTPEAWYVLGADLLCTSQLSALLYLFQLALV
jgi:hypothetical protein